MNKKFSTMLRWMAALALAAAIRPSPLLAQQAAQSSSTPVSMPASASQGSPNLAELEKKMVRIAAVQEQQVAALHSSNENYKFLLTGFGVLLTALVVAQGYLAYRQFKREGAGVEHVTEIMAVLKETLKTRLDAEKEARAEAESATRRAEHLEAVTNVLREFVERFEKNIDTIRRSIEDHASLLAQKRRHDFRQLPGELAGFAREFDAFQNQYQPLEQGKQRTFTARVMYMRGIAAHYANRPELAKHYLERVIQHQHAELGETDGAYKRRMANAFYYLGTTESNFGNAQNAIDAFKHAADLDPGNSDFLTRIVTAEAQVMSGSSGSSEAEAMLVAVEKGIDGQRDRAGRLQGVYLRLKSRARLIRAGIAIAANEQNWGAKVQELLEPVYRADPNYYYATATLAQAHAQQKTDQAMDYFGDAYDAIQHSGDLLTVTEVRSQILLHMVAALCCRNGPEKLRKNLAEHLDRANRLCDDLPQFDAHACTVFSPLSKGNVGKETIRAQLELIRDGHLRA